MYSPALEVLNLGNAILLKCMLLSEWPLWASQLTLLSDILCLSLL